MVDAPGTSIKDISAVLAQVLRPMPDVRDAWVSAHDEGYDLWVLTNPIDDAEERKFYALIATFYRTFPTDDFMLHVLNPNKYETHDPERIVPPSALRAYTPAST